MNVDLGWLDELLRQGRERDERDERERRLRARQILEQQNLDFVERERRLREEERLQEERLRRIQSTYRTRCPGWRVPNADHRRRWPMYETEAVTFDTEWGPVTVGRGLARIYDQGGWPEDLADMVRQQATS